MEKIRAKIAEWSKDRALVKLACIVLALLVILFAALCISSLMRTNIQEKYSRTGESLQQEAYENLNSMTQLFSRISDPNVDVRHKLIPALDAQYTSASAISRVLNENYSRKYAALSAEQIAAFDSAFEEFYTAYQTDSPTGLAQANMAECMEDVQAMVTDYYAPDEDPKEDVVIIDGASGKIQESADK